VSKQLVVAGHKDTTNVCEGCLELRTIGTNVRCSKEHNTIGGEFDRLPAFKMISSGRVTGDECLQQLISIATNENEAITHIFY
jgi:hypothetical protein